MLNKNQKIKIYRENIMKVHKENINLNLIIKKDINRYLFHSNK
jgi:hypothetical protein